MFPFDWSNDAIEQSSVVHQEILIPKTFGSFLVSDFTVYLNEILLSETVINIDDFSKDERIIHVVISQTELMDLFENEEITGDKIVLEIKPSSNVLMGLTENSQFKVTLDWEPRKIKSGQNMMLEFDILDVFLKDRPISVNYNLDVIHDNVSFFSENGVSTGVKDTQNRVEFLLPENVAGPITIKFSNLDNSELANLELPVIVEPKDPELDDRITSLLNNAKIPGWMKIVAEWWENGEIDDGTYLNIVQFLLDEGIIKKI